MLNRVLLPALVFAAVLLPAPARAWGFGPHRFIMERAIALLPADIRPFFEANRDFLVQHVLAPDTWRTAGFVEESPNHFLDFDNPLFGPPPHEALPRDLDRAIEKFGVDVIAQNGRLPWRTEQFAGELRRAFERRAKSDFGDNDVLEFTAWVTHYVSDSYVPFHATTNYDGQFTNQHGIHSRWEAALFDRYAARLAIRPAAVRPIPDVRGLIFSNLLEGERLVPEALRADLDAIGKRDVYDDAYFDAFFARTRPLLERRLNEAITGVASVITSEWEAAGRPAMPVQVARPVKTRKKAER